MSKSLRPPSSQMMLRRKGEYVEELIVKIKLWLCVKQCSLQDLGGGWLKQIMYPSGGVQINHSNNNTYILGIAMGVGKVVHLRYQS